MRHLLLIAFLATGASAQMSVVTNPGGTSGQLQYNDRGRFAGVAFTTSALASLGSSTNTFSIWQGTVSPRIAAHDVFMSTTGPLVDLLQVWKGTTSPVIDSLQVWKGTASPVLSYLNVWMGTASYTLDGKASSGTNADIRAFTLAVTHIGSDTFKSNVGIDGALTGTTGVFSQGIQVNTTCSVFSAAGLSLCYSGAAYIQALTAGGGALTNLNLNGSNVFIGPGSITGKNVQIDSSGNIISVASVTTGGGLFADSVFVSTGQMDHLTINHHLQFTGTYPHIVPDTVDGADISSMTISGGGNHDANHFQRGGTVRVYGNENVANPGDAILQAGTVTGGEVRLMASGANGLVLAQDLNVTIGQGLTVTTFTALIYSSAPIVYASTVAAQSGSDIVFRGDTGELILELDATGGTQGGMRIHRGTFNGSIVGDLELFDTGSPDFYFRRNDTGVTAGEYLGAIYWRDGDTSTGGGDEKAYYKVVAEGSWTSNAPMEQSHRWGLSRVSASVADYMILTSTGLLVIGWPGSPADTQVACDTCTAQFVSKTAGHGVDIVGNFTVTGNASVSGTLLASALKNNPVACTGDQLVSDIDADGTLICSTPIAGSGAELSLYNPSKTFGSTVTVKGNAFSVGVSSLIVDGGKVAISTPIGNGNLRVRAGTGNGGGPVAVTLFSWTGSSGTSTVGDTYGAQYTIPANTLATDGDSLRVVCMALSTTTSRSKSLFADINGDNFYDSNTTTTDSRWKLEFEMIRSAATTYNSSGVRWRSAGGSGGTFMNTYENRSADFSTDLVLSCAMNGTTTETGADADMRLIGMSVVYYPAP